MGKYMKLNECIFPVSFLQGWLGKREAKQERIDNQLPEQECNGKPAGPQWWTTWVSGITTDAAIGCHWSTGASDSETSGLMRTTVALSDHLLHPSELLPPLNDAHVSIKATFTYITDVKLCKREYVHVDTLFFLFFICKKQYPIKFMKSGSQVANSFMFYSLQYLKCHYFCPQLFLSILFSFLTSEKFP